MTSDFYVYFHMDGDEIVYVGKGSRGRAWDCQTGKNRSAAHSEFMLDRLPFLDIKFPSHGITEDEADSLEKLMIGKHQPKFNRLGGGGVGFNKGVGKWQARATLKRNKRLSLGYYATQQEANEALEKFWETL